MSLTFVHTKIKSFCPCGLLLCILSCIIRSAWWSHHKPVPHQSEKGLWKNDLHQAGIWCIWMVQLFQSQGEGSCNPLVALCCWGVMKSFYLGSYLSPITQSARENYLMWCSEFLGICLGVAQKFLVSSSVQWLTLGACWVPFCWLKADCIWYHNGLNSVN